MEYEVADEPRGGWGQPEIGGEAVALGVLDNALGDVERHGANDVLGADAACVACVDVAQGDANVVAVFGDVAGDVGIAFRLLIGEFALVGQLWAALDLGVGADGFG